MKIEVQNAINAEARKVIGAFKQRAKKLKKAERETLKKNLIDRAWARLRPFNVSRLKLVHEIGVVTENLRGE